MFREGGIFRGWDLQGELMKSGSHKDLFLLSSKTSSWGPFIKPFSPRHGAQHPSLHEVPAPSLSAPNLMPPLQTLRLGASFATSLLFTSDSRQEVEFGLISQMQAFPKLSLSHCALLTNSLTCCVVQRGS